MINLKDQWDFGKTFSLRLRNTELFWRMLNQIKILLQLITKVQGSRIYHLIKWTKDKLISNKIIISKIPNQLRCHLEVQRIWSLCTTSTQVNLLGKTRYKYLLVQLLLMILMTTRILHFKLNNLNRLFQITILPNQANV